MNALEYALIFFLRGLSLIITRVLLLNSTEFSFWTRPTFSVRGSMKLLKFRIKYGTMHSTVLYVTISIKQLAHTQFDSNGSWKMRQVNQPNDGHRAWTCKRWGSLQRIESFWWLWWEQSSTKDLPHDDCIWYLLT